jgi:voltage-gated potassium channel
MNMRKRLFEIIEAARGEDRASSIYDAFMIVLIVISLVPLAVKGEHPALNMLDKVCACVFALDYLARLLTADYKYKSASILSFVRYPLSFMAIVDLLSILPSFTAVNGSLKVLRVMRMFRALRILRVLKIARYSHSIRIIGRVFRRSKDALIAVGSLALAYVLISALVILNLEPDSFDNFFEAIYWATVSLTTMGYGDIYPVTTVGRVFTMLSSIFGIAIVALPSGILTAGYMSELAKETDLPGEEEP